MRDVRDVIRALLVAPKFTVLAVSILSLGIAASTVMYTIVDTVLLRRLPFSRADRLISITEPSSRNPRVTSVNPQDFFDWADQKDVFDGLAAIGYSDVLTGGDNPEPILAKQVSASLFSVLGTAPLLGTTFGAGNEVTGADRVGVIGYALWQRRFGGDPAIVGRTVRFKQGPFVILGVMPPGFSYPVGLEKPMEMWMPYVPTSKERYRTGSGQSHYLEVVGRMKDGVSLKVAQERLDQITATVTSEHPGAFKDVRVSLTSLEDALFGRVRPWMLMLLFAVGLLLVIACTNVASLMLLRSTDREREMAVRSALGATHSQLVVALLAEGVIVAAISTTVGVGLAWWGVQVAKAALPAGIPRAATIAIDLRILCVVAATAIATGLFCSVLPAVRMYRMDFCGVLRDGRLTPTRLRLRARGALITAEIALATALFAGAGLFVASFWRLLTVDLGVARHGVITVRVSPSFEGTDADRAKLSQASLADLIEHIRLIPQVEAVGLIQGGLPMSGASTGSRLTLTGSDGTTFTDVVDTHTVTWDYFRAVGTRLIRGRLIKADDINGSTLVALLNEQATRRYFKDADPIGATIGLVGQRTVVGVVADVRTGGPEGALRPEVYIPMPQSLATGGDLVVRTAAGTANIASSIAALVGSLIPRQPLPTVRSFDESFRRLTAERRLNMTVMTLIALLAMIVASTGVYGVVAYSTAERTREIGVRLALGGRPMSILASVVGRGMVYISLGIVLGLLGAVILSRVVASLLFEVSPRDPVVYLSVAAILATVGVLATLVPAHRASRIDPIVALRSE